MADEPKQEAPKTEAPVNGASVPMTVMLRRAIQANGEEVKELRFREPTANDIDQVGNPVNIDMLGGDTPKISFNERVMTRMMAQLAAVPPSSIKQMNTRDWETAAWTLASHFMPDL